ncbi:MAG TPA: hypothetical protein VGQ76_21200 [Thermoanaerobaculia bacterium]|nr:hypothetical protein [Thermoanaerobaculia bacterium]
MAQPKSSLYAITRWTSIVAETKTLLQHHDELMQERMELVHRRAMLFCELVRTAKGFVADAETVMAKIAQPTGTSTGTVASSRSR